jgi:hypothetical protein
MSPNQPSTPHHQRLADIGNSATKIRRNWCFEPEADMVRYRCSQQQPRSPKTSAVPQKEKLPFVVTAAIFMPLASKLRCEFHG